MPLREAKREDRELVLGLVQGQSVRRWMPRRGTGLRDTRGGKYRVRSLIECAGGRRRGRLVTLLTSQAILKVRSLEPVRKATSGVPPGLMESETGVRPSQLCLHSPPSDAPRV